MMKSKSLKIYQSVTALRLHVTLFFFFFLIEPVVGVVVVSSPLSFPLIFPQSLVYQQQYEVDSLVCREKIVDSVVLVSELS